jgi:hypothetical protein
VRLLAEANCRGLFRSEFSKRSVSKWMVQYVDKRVYLNSIRIHTRFHCKS